MAKEVKEIKEVQEPTVEDAFLEKDAPLEEPQEKVETPAEEPEKPESPELEEPEASSTPEGFDWSDYGLDHFTGKTQEQIAQEISWQNKKFGEQSNEVGKLRKEAEEFKKGVTVKPSLQEELPTMSEGQITDFNEEWNKNPTNALLKYVGPQFQKQIVNEIKDSLSTEFQGMAKSQIADVMDDMEYKSLLTDNPDMGELEPLMKKLDAPDLLGKQRRPLKELLGLAGLSQDKDPLYNPVYHLMHQHPTMAFDKAKEIANLQLSSSETSDTKRQNFKRTAKKLGSANSRSTATPKTDKPNKVESIDEAFDATDED